MVMPITPSQGWRTNPARRSLRCWRIASIATERLTAPSRVIATINPITSPRSLIRAPPESPGQTTAEARTCGMPGRASTSVSRKVPLVGPARRRGERPSAVRIDPGCSSDDDPSAAVGRGRRASTLISAAS